MDFSTNALGFRVAFFFSHIVQRPDTIFLALSKDLPFFDTMPHVQPLPPGIQSEQFPLVRLRSSTNIFHCEISQSRLDFIVKLDEKYGTIKYEPIFEEFKSISIEILNYILTQTTIPINRVGVVADAFLQFETPSLAVDCVSKLIGKDIGKGFMEYSVRTNKPKVISGIMCNDILISETGQFNKSGNVIGGVLFSRDINTHHSEADKINEKSLRPILEGIIPQMSLESFNNLGERYE